MMKMFFDDTAHTEIYTSSVLEILFSLLERRHREGLTSFHKSIILKRVLAFSRIIRRSFP